MNITPHALGAYDAGWCVIRVRADGSKAPDGLWRQYQTTRPTRVDVAKMFASDWPGIGVVTGAVSGNLTMFELEGRAVAAGVVQRFGELARFAGPLAEAAWQLITRGYGEVTPSGGLHFYYRTVGPALPNTKLARDADGEVLIETRGEGGFSVIAPSHGPTHKTGQPWAVMFGSPAGTPTLTEGEATALFAVAAMFDESPAWQAPEVVVPTARLEVPRATLNGYHASWMDATEALIADRWSMPELLEVYGWQHDHDASGRAYYTRPGKESGTSAAVNESGRLVVFSTSTPFEPYNGTRAPSYGLLDVIATYEHHGDRQAAAYRIATEAGVFEQQRESAWRMLADTVTPDNRVRLDPPRAADTAVNAVLSGERGEAGRLPPEFWQGRSDLEAIREAALCRMVAPTALMHACLARVAAIVPFEIVLPPTIGDVIGLSFLTIVVGPPEAGKSSVKGVAKRLFPAPQHVLDDLPAGSGEGLADVLFEYVNEVDPTTGKSREVRRQIHHNAFVYVDEGEVLNTLTARGNSTLMSTLRSVFMGEGIGQNNSRADTRRIVPAGRYSFGVLVGMQPDALGPIFDGTKVGTPQRFTYSSALDPHADKVKARSGAPVDPVPWHPPRDGQRQTVGGMSRMLLSYPDHVSELVVGRRFDVLTGALEVRQIDAHRVLMRCKVAGLLAVLAGRCDVIDDDWRRAGLLVECSEFVRDACISAVSQDAERAESAHANKLAKRALTADRVMRAERVERGALAIARKVGKLGATGASDLKRSFSSGSDARVYWDDAYARAVERGWIAERVEPMPHGGSPRHVVEPGSVPL